jgi:hypothetical protein
VQGQNKQQEKVIAGISGSSSCHCSRNPSLPPNVRWSTGTSTCCSRRWSGQSLVVIEFKNCENMRLKIAGNKITTSPLVLPPALVAAAEPTACCPPGGRDPDGGGSGGFPGRGPDGVFLQCGPEFPVGEVICNPYVLIFVVRTPNPHHPCGK